MPYVKGMGKFPYTKAGKSAAKKAAQKVKAKKKDEWDSDASSDVGNDSDDGFGPPPGKVIDLLDSESEVSPQPMKRARRASSTRKAIILSDSGDSDAEFDY